MNDIPREVALHLIGESLFCDLYDKTKIIVVEDSQKWVIQEDCIGVREVIFFIVNTNGYCYRLIDTRISDGHGRHIYKHSDWEDNVPVDKVQVHTVSVNQWSVVK